MIQMNLQNRNKLTDLVKVLIFAGEGVWMGGRDSYGVWDVHVHTAIIKIDNQ